MCNNKENICVICLENCEEEYLLLECNHFFHTECIYKYISFKFQEKYIFFSKEINCPLCRKNLSKNDLSSIFDIYITELKNSTKTLLESITFFRNKIIWYNIKDKFTRKSYKTIVNKYNEYICELYYCLNSARMEKSRLKIQKKYFC
jgi:hypothetical protein